MINYLLSNRTTRDFLNNFPEKKWNQIILNTLTIGIENLKQNYNIVKLTNEDIKSIASRMKQGIEPTNLNNFNENHVNYEEFNEDFQQPNENDLQQVSNKNNMNYDNVPFNINPNYLSQNQYKKTNIFNNDLNLNNQYPVDYIENVKNKNYNIIDNRNTQNQSNYVHNNSKNKQNHQNNHYNTINNSKQNYQQDLYKTRAKTPNLVTRNKRCTDSVGMLNSIYPDWWASQENCEYDDREYVNENDEEFDELSTLKNAKNKHFTQKLSLQEKRALIGKSRRDNGDSSTGTRSCSTGYVRGRSLGINTRDRIYDRPEKIEVIYFLF